MVSGPPKSKRGNSCIAVALRTTGKRGGHDIAATADLGGCGGDELERRCRAELLGRDDELALVRWGVDDADCPDAIRVGDVSIQRHELLAV